jgi:hypothetical protein
LWGREGANYEYNNNKTVTVVFLKFFSTVLQKVNFQVDVPKISLGGS